MRWISGSGSSMIDPSSNVIVLEQPAFACGGAALFDLSAEPVVVVHRVGQQVERHLVDRAAVLRGQARQLRFEFGRKLQVHKASVGAIPKLVNLGVRNRPSRSVCTGRSLEMVGTSNMKLHGPNADDLSAESDRPLASFGFTDRQSRFLVTVMRHAGVFVGRQYVAFANITHGQKVHDFIQTLLVRRFAISIELGTTGRTRIIHVHYKRVKAIQQKLDRLDEAFLYSESIDLTSYSRQRDKLREELTLAQIERHTEAVDELDVQGILAFAERILPRASDLWVQASLDYKQRLQQLFFPEGIAYDGNRFNRTAATGTNFQLLGAVREC